MELSLKIHGCEKKGKKCGLRTDLRWRSELLSTCFVHVLETVEMRQKGWRARRRERHMVRKVGKTEECEMTAS